MSRSFMILFVVSVDTWLNENSLLVLNFFYIAFILRLKAIFLIRELIASFSDGSEVSSGQLKRFSESVIDPKCLLKVEGTSFFFNNLSFSSNIIFFVYYMQLGAFLSKTQTRLFSKTAYVHSRHTITNIQYKLVTVKLFGIYFFGSNMSNFVLRIVYII